jgi:hypothetical protein
MSEFIALLEPMGIGKSTAIEVQCRNLELKALSHLLRLYSHSFIHESQNLTY